MVMTTTRPREKEQSDSTFKCRYCGKDKPLDDMKALTRFFPPVVACRECERKTW